MMSIQSVSSTLWFLRVTGAAPLVMYDRVTPWIARTRDVFTIRAPMFNMPTLL